MFGNIGGKIKVFVIVLTILEIIACILCGIGVIAFSVFGDSVMKPLSKIGLDDAVMNLAGDVNGPFGIVVGLVVMIVGSLGAWLISFIPYGLGQLIQNTDKMVKGMEGIRATMARNASHSSGASQPAITTYPNPYASYNGGYVSPMYQNPNAAPQNAYVNQRNGAYPPNTYANPAANPNPAAAPANPNPAARPAPGARAAASANPTIAAHRAPGSAPAAPRGPVSAASKTPAASAPARTAAPSAVKATPESEDKTVAVREAAKAPEAPVSEPVAAKAPEEKPEAFKTPNLSAFADEKETENK